MKTEKTEVETSEFQIIPKLAQFSKKYKSILFFEKVCLENCLKDANEFVQLAINQANTAK